MYGYKACFYLGNSPIEEESVQVNSSKPYMDNMRKESLKFLQLLKKLFPEYRKYNCAFKIEKSLHEFGSYQEVKIEYNENDQESELYAVYVENFIPEYWNEEKVKISFDEFKIRFDEY